MRVWLDIDNPPQVQYLLPFVSAFTAAGVDTVVTARDYGETLNLLGRGGVEFASFGARLPRSRARKAIGLIRRSRSLKRHLRDGRRPDALLGASRAGAVTARRLGIPSYIIGDYEYADVSVYRLTGSVILHPEAIDGRIFVARGLRAEQLVPFRGVKEDISFTGVDVDAVLPHRFAGPPGVPRVLFRPPSETSHYARRESGDLARAALRRLAGQPVQIAFSPREPAQVSYLEGIHWRHAPVVLNEPVPFIALLKSVDAVVCSGGTMLREAAYLGLPAFSIFNNRIGGVDRWLAALGRATLIESELQLDLLEAGPRPPLRRLDSNPHLLEEIVAFVAEGARPPSGNQGMAPGLGGPEPRA